MEKNPRLKGDYVVITLRLPVRLLAQLARWLVLLAAAYGWLHR